MSGFGHREYVATRQHKRRCAICGETIIAGDAVKTGCMTDAGDFYSWINHAVCESLLTRDDIEDGWTSRYYVDDAGEDVREKFAAALAKARAK